MYRTFSGLGLSPCLSTLGFFLLSVLIARFLFPPDLFYILFFQCECFDSWNCDSIPKVLSNYFNDAKYNCMKMKEDEEQQGRGIQSDLHMQPLVSSHFWFLLLSSLFFFISLNCPKYSYAVWALCFFTFWQFTHATLSNSTFLLPPRAFQTTLFWINLFARCHVPASIGCSGCERNSGMQPNLKRMQRNHSSPAAGASMLINHPEISVAFKRHLNYSLETTDLWQILELLNAAFKM